MMSLEHTLLYSAVRIAAIYYFEDNSPSTIYGTGFIVECPDRADHFAIVSNKHVLLRAWKEPLWEGARQLFVVEVWTHRNEKATLVMDPTTIYHHDDDSIDVAAIPFDMRRVIQTTHRNLRLGNVIHWNYVEMSQKEWENLVPSETVYFPGYPQWYDRNGGRPIMRTGAIVSDPLTDYRLKEGEPDRDDGNRQVLFEAFSSDGNSGSPVFVSQRGFKAGGGITYSGAYHPAFLVGINAGHFELHDGAVETVDGKLILTNWHVGLSRMFKTSAIVDVVQELADSYAWPDASTADQPPESNLVDSSDDTGNKPIDQ
jgi:hypothetical protein